ncbi:adenylylsulfatase HINT3-like [Chenopodium quinoa]|uniref:adenylylsulfatase HINT3-like n=1 Tax=Chenopodium quinoa TaxID=63459 RepID=UPI000B788D40|nr:adenylylsulfatase HINT3-like [Chenopodium quinoa]
MNSEARRRIAVLCSHICPSHINSQNTHIVSTSNCSSESTTAQVQTRDLVKNPNSQDTCIFCQIIQGNSPAFKLYEDDTCICILDTSPLSRGHSLLIPKRHFCSLDTTHPSVIAAMCSKIPFISNAIKKATGCDSFNLVVNNGAAAGQVIFHTHIHIIPRKAHDRLWDSESLRRLSVKLDEEAPHLVESIREHLLLAKNEEECKDQGSALAGNCRG